MKLLAQSLIFTDRWQGFTTCIGCKRTWMNYAHLCVGGCEVTWGRAGAQFVLKKDHGCYFKSLFVRSLSRHVESSLEVKPLLSKGDDGVKRLSKSGH